ncbi:MAG TPA: helix-turn-helix domain-containing protein [Chloroflexia bacterium]|nr:helix-turn-helix domain-containing protein [Chloroflexia bacterium]
MQLGPNLRAARLRRGMTLADLAAAGGLSKGFVSQVENDKTSPSLDTLERLAAALDVAVVDLLRGAGEPPPSPHHVPGALLAALSAAVRRQPQDRAGLVSGVTMPSLVPTVREISPPGAVLRSFVVALPPGTTLGEPGHQHGGEETLVVVHGALLAEQAGALEPLRTGDALTWTPGQPHRLLNRSPEPARVLVTLMAPASLGALGVVGSPAARAETQPAQPGQGRALRLVQMRAARERPSPGSVADHGRPDTPGLLQHRGTS